MVSIHRPLGYGPSTLPLRHAAVVEEKVSCPMLMRKKEKKKEEKSLPCFLRGRKKEAPNKGLEPLTLRLKV